MMERFQSGLLSFRHWDIFSGRKKTITEMYFRKLLKPKKS